MRKLFLRTLIVIFFSFPSLSAEVREHFLIGWIGGKSFVGERGHTFDQGDLGFYQQFYLQFYLSKRIGFQLELGEQIHRNYIWGHDGRVVKTEDKEGYALLTLIYKFPELKKNLTPYLFFKWWLMGKGSLCYKCSA